MASSSAVFALCRSSVPSPKGSLLGLASCMQLRGKSAYSQSQKRVCIIGAGVAGLQTARALRAQGFQPTIFESTGDIGGVWQSNYANFGLQVPRQVYEFPDFPFSSAKWNSYPKGSEVQQYIQDYARHFDLKHHIRFNTAVKTVESEDKQAWRVTFEANKAEKTETFDYCVVATGMYNRPNMPNWPGRSNFQGLIYHSSDFTSVDGLAGKKVVVIGNGKSAVDCAVNASRAGAKTTLLSRSAHWPTPRKIANLIELQYIFYSRFGQALVVGHKGPMPDAAANYDTLMHRFGWPVFSAIFKVVEVLFAAQFRQLKKSDLSPFGKADVVEDFYSAPQVMDYSLRDAVQAREVTWLKGEVSKFTETGIEFGGEELEADVVVCATGFLKDYSIFEESLQGQLGREEDGLWLHRHILPTKIPNLAFIGSEVGSVSNITTHSVQAAWLGQAWTGKMALPSSEQMEKTLEAMKAWKRSWMPKSPVRANQVLLHQISYHDSLLKDMGVSHHRKAPNYLKEVFQPYQSGDYDGIVDPEPATSTPEPEVA